MIHLTPARFVPFGQKKVPFIGTDAGWSSSVARRAHNPEAAGSNPVPATDNPVLKETGFCFAFYVQRAYAP